MSSFLEDNSNIIQDCVRRRSGIEWPQRERGVALGGQVAAAVRVPHGGVQLESVPGGAAVGHQRSLAHADPEAFSAYTVSH